MNLRINAKSCKSTVFEFISSYIYENNVTTELEMGKAWVLVSKNDSKPYKVSGERLGVADCWNPAFIHSFIQVLICSRP